MTIVGIEKLNQGDFNVLVFDPKYHDTEKWNHAMEQALLGGEVEEFLRTYRRGTTDLRKYTEFEILECA